MVETIRAQHGAVCVSLAVLLVTSVCWSSPATARAGNVQDALIRATRMEAAGDLDGALKLYRRLCARYPRRTDILLRQESLLSRMGHYEEAVALLKWRLSKAPADITARLRIAEALYTLGRHEEAFENWDHICRGVVRSAQYALVADRYRKHNLYDRAADTYRKGRRALDKPLLFARELAELAELRARYPEAVEEYLRFLQIKPQYVSLVTSRLREFAGEGGSQDTILSRLAREARERPDNGIGAQLLTDYALSAARPEFVLQVLTEDKRETRWHVELLLRIASHALKHGAYPAAESAYGAVLGRSRVPDHVPRSLLGLARSKQGLGRADDAREQYRDLIRRYPRRPEADEGRYRLGVLLADAYDDTAASLAAFRDLVDVGRHSSWRCRALFEIGKALFLQDDLKGAEAAYRRIVGGWKGREEADNARFKMAELRFLSGDFEAAQRLLQQLLSGPMSRYVLNDALRLSVLIQGGTDENPAALRSLATALVRQRRGDAESALEALGALLEDYPRTVIKDRALVAKAEVLEVLGRHVEAIEVCRRLAEEMPWSPFGPWAQMALARIYEERLGQYEEARRSYEALLVDHPRSLEADEARDHLRALPEKIRRSEGRQQEAG